MQTTSDMWAAGIEYPLGIFDAATGAVVGGTGVNHINHAYRIGNIGYWVSSKRTGEGIARFAAHQSAVLGFRELGLTRLEIVVLTHNALVYSLVPEDLR
jgi:RimJ/RimL family protein N-acetyltransferase